MQITLPPGYTPTAIPAPEPVASPLSPGAPPPAPEPEPEPEPLPFGYTLTAGAAVQRSDGALIPADPANPAWQEYQRWLAAGHTAAPYVAPPPPPLEEQRAIVWERIKARRDALRAGGVKVGQHWFHSDADSRIQQLGLTMMGANMPPNLKWKTIDNGLVDMTPTLAGQIFSATAQHDATVFGVAETHRAALAAATDPLAYDWSAGWPQESPEDVS